MGKEPSDSRAVRYLAENGPSPREELPVQNLATTVRALIGTLNISGGPGGGGSTAGVAGGLTEVAYLRGEHDLEAVVEAWIDANEEQVEQLSADSVRRRLRASVPREQRDVVSEVLSAAGHEVDYTGRGGRQTDPFECSLCGSSVPDIAAHLPECPEG
ncbi:hypothetical protein B4589_014645 [Halolamina sp. CBA1230]|uniref:hypothetical protein n=1 Tax=Halolamina sp. CBA1230 TaxID=1853690 RepID=UPI0009A22F43|nr:hypothetical protein [Halolamina sp. CBA1230]QKY21551.1 hypothetical protein B4589_014645 [Halolamina sp. CBA1230]